MRAKIKAPGICLLITIIILQFFTFSQYHRNMGVRTRKANLNFKQEQKFARTLEQTNRGQISKSALHGFVPQLQSDFVVPQLPTKPYQSRIESLQELQKTEILHVTGEEDVKNQIFLQNGQQQEQEQQKLLQQNQKETPKGARSWPIRDPPGLVGMPLGKWEGNIFVFPAGNEANGCVAHDAHTTNVIAAVVIVAFNRPQYLKQMLDFLFQAYDTNQQNYERFPLYISQDGTDTQVADVAKSFARKRVRYMQHIEIMNVTTEKYKENVAYYRIANHYKYIIQQFFQCFKYPKLLILEDDMQLSVDFFEYFAATSQLLDNDPTLYCISSWNDHGQERYVKDAVALYRSDFFPGLGWMLTQNLGLELLENWPKSYWDDWMRLTDVRQGRQCVRPEVCRNYNFGEKGTSKGFYYRKFIKPIKLNIEPVDWTHTDLSYLEHNIYEQHFMQAVSAAHGTNNPEVAKTWKGDVRLEYNSQEQYEGHTLSLGMLREWKDGVPRGAYNGIVTVRYENARIFLAPSNDFKGAEQVGTDQRVVVDQTGAVVRKKSKGPKLK